MKTIKMNLLIGEKLKCSRCGRWLENEFVWMHLNDNRTRYELLCKECHEEEEKAVRK